MKEVENKNLILILNSSVDVFTSTVGFLHDYIKNFVVFES